MDGYQLYFGEIAYLYILKTDVPSLLVTIYLGHIKALMYMSNTFHCITF